jgi:hypothetical protein
VRRLVGLALLVGGPVLYLRRREARRDQVELLFEDGSAVTFASGTLDGDALLAVARQGV